jgi:PAS domain S-box-containing protein
MRERAELDLREIQRRFEGIVDSAMDAIISINEAQRVVLFNAAAERMFGCAAVEALGQPLERFIPARLRAVHRAHVRAFATTGVTNRTMGKLGSLTALRADGREFPIEASISQTEVGGDKLFTVILRDITRRQEAEEALSRSEAQLRALAARLQRAREEEAIRIARESSTTSSCGTKRASDRWEVAKANGSCRPVSYNNFSRTAISAHRGPGYGEAINQFVLHESLYRRGRTGDPQGYR